MTLNRAIPTTDDDRPAPRYVTDTLDISLIAEDTYCLLGSTRTLGFVKKRDNVFVGLWGDDLLRAMPVGESLSFDACVAMVVRASRR